MQRRSKFNEAMSVDNKWITLMKSVSTATRLTQDLVDESVELVKVHEGGAVELVMKYGDIYELTIQSTRTSPCSARWPGRWVPAWTRCCNLKRP